VYQVPLDVPVSKRFYFASKWLIDYARAKKGKPMANRLADEFLAAYAGQGAAVKKKEDTHKMAEANKAFAYLAKYVK
jgi:small subunit ribosomal protein S7